MIYTMRLAKIGALTSLLVLLLIYRLPAAQSQDPTPLAPDSKPTTDGDTYKLRVENARFGRVEISLDGGEHYLLVGRVQKPATGTAPDRDARQAGVVVRGSADGIAFAVSVGQIIKLLPGPEAGDHGARARLADGAVVTDIKRGTGPFGVLGPPAGSPALQQLARGGWKPFPNDYAPAVDDIFAFTTLLTTREGSKAPGSAPADPVAPASLEALRRQLTATSELYESQATTRAHEHHYPIVNGMVVLRAKLPEGEPEPVAAVTYSVDNDIVSAQNIFPPTYVWDSKRVANGEHVVEIRALSKYATVITRVRTLVIVNNAP